jgi:O-antigen/teichoic acid export membrane protein
MKTKNLVTAAFSFAFSKGLASGAGLLLAVLLPLVMPLEDVGSVYLAISLVGLLSIVQKFGIDYHALNLALISDGSRAAVAKIYISSLAFILPYSLMVVLVVVSGWNIAKSIGLYLVFDSTTVGFILLWSTGACVISTLFQMYKALGDTMIATLTRAFFQNFVFVLFLLTAYGLSFPLTSKRVIAVFALLTVLVAVLNTCCFLARAGGLASLSYSDSNSSPSTSSMWSVIPYFMYSIAVFILGELDVWLVYFLLDAKSVAVYGTVKRFLLIVTLIVDFSNVAVPNRLAYLMREGSMLEAQTLLKRVSLVSTGIASFVFVCVAIASEPLFQLIFGDRIPNILQPLLILIGAQVINVFIGSAELVLITGKSNRFRVQLAKTATVAILIQIAATFIFAEFWPLLAAPLGYAVGVVTYRVTLSALVKRFFGISTYAGW